MTSRFPSRDLALPLWRVFGILLLGTQIVACGEVESTTFEAGPALVSCGDAIKVYAVGRDHQLYRTFVSPEKWSGWQRTGAEFPESLTSLDGACSADQKVVLYGASSGKIWSLSNESPSGNNWRRRDTGSYTGHWQYGPSVAEAPNPELVAVDEHNSVRFMSDQDGNLVFIDEASRPPALRWLKERPITATANPGIAVIDDVVHIAYRDESKNVYHVAAHRRAPGMLEVHPLEGLPAQKQVAPLPKSDRDVTEREDARTIPPEGPVKLYPQEKPRPEAELSERPISGTTLCANPEGRYAVFMFLGKAVRDSAKLWYSWFDADNGLQTSSAMVSTGTPLQLRAATTASGSDVVSPDCVWSKSGVHVVSRDAEGHIKYTFSNPSAASGGPGAPFSDWVVIPTP